MKFLKTLLWVIVAAFVVILAARNWQDVTIYLWGDLRADVKIPVLMFAAFLAGFLPAWLTYRAKLWRAARRTPVPVPATPAYVEEAPE